MIATITNDAPAGSLEQTIELLSSEGFQTALGRDSEGRVTVAAFASGRGLPGAHVAELLPPGVIADQAHDAVLSSRAFRAQSSAVRVGEAVFGGGAASMIAGPCAVESTEALTATAQGVHSAGVGVLRAGAYKPRTSPYSFRGHGRDGLRILAEVAGSLGLPVVTEVLDPGEVSIVAAFADVLQIGTRNMANAHLVEAAAATGRPILIKRGFAATLDETLFAAEYALAAGATDVILCERGIRSFDQGTRNVLDVVAIAELARRTHLPIIADPSHATGRRDLVAPAALAALAAGADGLVIEVHHAPEAALVDGDQSLSLAEYEQLVQSVEGMLSALGRTLAVGPECPVPHEVVA